MRGGAVEAGVEVGLDIVMTMSFGCGYTQEGEGERE